MTTLEYTEKLRQALQRDTERQAATCTFQLRRTPKVEPTVAEPVTPEPVADVTPTNTVEFDTTLRTLAAQATERYAGEKARIDRGLTIALNHGVIVHADGSADVQSASDPEVVYHVAHGTCDCPDFTRAPDGRCKHRYAVCLVKKATKAMAYYSSTTDSQGLVLGGHRATADAKRAEEEAAGGLAYLVCHHNGARRN